MRRKFEKVNQLIINGSISLAQKEIKQLENLKLSRKDRLELAILAKRSFLPVSALSLLKRIVRSEKRLPSPPTQNELLEYSNCLIMINALLEAEQILLSLETDQTPEVLNGLAALYFKRWEYKKGIGYIEQYINHPKTSNREIMVSKVNLIQAYVHEKMFFHAKIIFDDIIPRLKEEKKHLLLAAIYEFQAEQFIHQRKWNDAKLCINKSFDVLSNKSDMDILYLKKINLLYDLYKNPHSKLLKQKIIDIKKFANELGHYETLRDVDFHYAVLTKNKYIALKLWFGTPYESYKRKIEKECSLSGIPNKFEYVIGGNNNNSENLFLDLTDGKTSSGRSLLKKNHILQRLLITLFSDLYKPLSVFEIYSFVYAGQYFNPISSPNSIHQAIKRLREFFRRYDLPIEIIETNGLYLLNGLKKITIIIPNQQYLEKRPDIRILDFTNKCRKIWGERLICANDVSLHFNVSQNTAVKWLNDSLEHGLIQRRGQGRATRYWIV